MLPNGKFLAFDTSTDAMSVAVTDGARLWQHTGPGGAKASTTLIPVVMALMADAGLALGDLEAIVFGRGPGSFTGLRTACAVAQGLAFGANAGAGVPVLPVDTLQAVAEEARLQPSAEASPYITALLDARMDEMYVQRYAAQQEGQGVLTPLGTCGLMRPEHLLFEPTTLYPGTVLAGFLAPGRGRLPGCARGARWRRDWPLVPTLAPVCRCCQSTP